MRNLTAAWIATLACLLLAPTVSGAINGAYDFTDTFDFEQGLDAKSVMLVSGAMDATVTNQRGAYAFVDPLGLEIQGLDRVCWSTGRGQCSENGLSIAVLPDSTVGMRFPGQATLNMEAGHALGTFRDMSGELSDLDLPNQAFISALTSATITLSDLPTIPHSGTVPDPDATGVLVGINPETRIEVRRGTNVVGIIRGDEDLVTFEGQPIISPFQAGAAIMPFGPGASADMAPATGTDAGTGLNLDNLNNALTSLQGGQPSEQVPKDALTQAGEGLLQALLNGAVLEMPGTLSELDFGQVTIIRFDTMALASQPGSLSAVMAAPLILQGGEVTGAKSLVTVKWFAFPWWSIVLWVGALTVMVIRLVARPPRKHPKWDKLQWAGRISGFLATLLVLWLWDQEIQAVLGFSMLNARPDVSTGLLLLLELGIFSLVMFATAAPLRLLLGNAFMLARQGRFMGIANPIASLLGFLLGAQLLLSYLEFILSQA